jgi:hypothetical protein
MSNRPSQLRLVSKNSPPQMNSSKLDSVKCKPLRVNCLGSRLAAKSVRLEREHPEAAALIEQFIDDALADGPRRWPTLE